jgi:hypothetical protein
MKKHLLSLAAGAFLATTLAHCGGPSQSYPAPVQQQQQQQQVNNNPTPTNVPEWYLNPEPYVIKNYGKEGSFFYGVGQSTQPIASLAKKTADSRARDEVSQQVGIEVKSKVQDYMAASGGGENPGVVQFAEAVSKQISSAGLVGAKTVKRGVSPDGKTYFALVIYSLNEAQRLAAKSITQTKSSFKGNEDAMFSEWKARKAFDELDGDDFANKLSVPEGN